MKRPLAACILILLLSLPALAAPALYSAVIEDLPLMPGMTELAEEAVVFDSPAGRILETTTQTQAPAGEILGFYAETLPALGWTAQPPAAFVREGETLTIGIEQENGLARARFNLTPGK